MAVVKAHRFAASAHWHGESIMTARAKGKPTLDVAEPPEFKGGIEGVWSPEELLVPSAASCLAITIAAVADARGAELREIDVDGVGQVERVPGKGFRFLVIELTVEVEAEDEHPHVVQGIVEEAERRCIVRAALDVPVKVRLVVATAAGVALSG